MNKKRSKVGEKQILKTKREVWRVYNPRRIPLCAPCTLNTRGVWKSGEIRPLYLALPACCVSWRKPRGPLIKPHGPRAARLAHLDGGEHHAHCKSTSKALEGSLALSRDFARRQP